MADPGNQEWLKVMRGKDVVYTHYRASRVALFLFNLRTMLKRDRLPDYKVVDAGWPIRADIWADQWMELQQ
jgi:hypothetical protein